MTKKVLAVLLAVLMVAALATGCSGSGTTSTASTSSTASTASVASTASDDETSSAPEEPTTFDMSEKRDVSLILVQNSFINDYQENDLTKKMEEELNCNLNIEVLPAGDDGTTRLMAMINGGTDLPDVLSINLSGALTYQYGTGGTLLPLEEYLDDPVVMPNFTSIESEADKAQMIAVGTAADGHVYALARFEPEAWNLTPYRMFINTTWLSNLGLEMPTTTDELKDVLTAFANDDPNGNGVADELAVFAEYVNGGDYGANVILAIINFFVPTNTSMAGATLSEDGKTVVMPSVSDEWKQAVTYLHELYEAGAIKTDSFAYDGTAYNGILNYQGIGTEPAEEGKSINIVGLFSCGSNTGRFSGAGTDSNANFLEYRMMPIMDSGVGEGYTPYAGYKPDMYWYVSENAKDVPFCVHMGDWFYARDNSISVRYGTKGDPLQNDDGTWQYAWTDDPTFCSDWYQQHTELLKGFADMGAEQTKVEYKYVVLDEGVWSRNNSQFWHNCQPRYLDAETFNYHYGRWYDPENYQYYLGNTYNGVLGPENLEYYGDRHLDHLLPELIFTDDEQTAISDFQLTFPDTLMGWTINFITGERDIDTEWQTYLDDLENIGLSTYLEAAQAAYERTSEYQALA